MKLFTNAKIKALFCAVLSLTLLFAALSALFIVWDLPDAAPLILICALVTLTAVTAALYGYFRDQNRTLERAEEQIADYICGNRDARIECDDEGELNKLFHKINSLAAILNAHAENEERSRDFLKNAISDISHQLKTPLAALNIYNGILQSEADTPQMREFTALTEQELDRMETLVQDLLKMTKLDAGTIRFEPRTENISEMMRDVRQHFLIRAAQEEKQIFLDGDGTLTLSCDRIWLAQAVENLVKNALDHTEAGGKIHIAWAKLPSIVQITVQDNGCGIHPEDLPHIFKRFYRSRFSKDTQGAGLGLSLSKAIIEAHGGSIEVDSMTGRGTTFVINFIIPTKL